MSVSVLPGVQVERHQLACVFVNPISQLPYAWGDEHNRRSRASVPGRLDQVRGNAERGSGSSSLTPGNELGRITGYDV